MSAEQPLSYREFSNALEAMEKRFVDRFSAVDGRLSSISSDVRETRDSVASHAERLTTIEVRATRARKTSWGAAATAIALAVAEGVRLVLKP